MLLLKGFGLCLLFFSDLEPKTQCQQMEVSPAAFTSAEQLRSDLDADRCDEFVDLGIRCFFGAEKPFGGFNGPVYVLIPKNFKPQNDLDIDLYLHGIGNHQQQNPEHVDDPSVQNTLLKTLFDSGRNGVMIVPLSRARESDFMDFFGNQGKNSFDAFIKSFSTRFEKAGLFSSDKIKRLSVSSHSGGYKPTAAILKSQDRCKTDDPCYSRQITDVNLLDSTYGGFETFIEYGNREGKKLNIAYLRGSKTEPGALQIKDHIQTDRLGNLRLDPVSTSHYGVISKKLPDYL